MRDFSPAASVETAEQDFDFPIDQAKLKSILVSVARFPVLTVSDIPQFSDRRGGMIEFVQENERVRFRVNLSCAEKSGLTLSSHLLKVASAVKRGEDRD